MNQEDLKCPFCNHRFFNIHAYKLHLDKHLETWGYEPLRCPKCGKLNIYSKVNETTGYSTFVCTSCRWKED